MRRVAGALVNIRVRSSRSDLSGINSPVESLNRNSRQANKLLSQQNLPITNMPPSYDHLVGMSEHTGRYCETEHFGGLEIDHQLRARGGARHCNLGRFQKRHLPDLNTLSIWIS